MVTVVVIRTAMNKLEVSDMGKKLDILYYMHHALMLTNSEGSKGRTQGLGDIGCRVPSMRHCVSRVD